MASPEEKGSHPISPLFDHVTGAETSSMPRLEETRPWEKKGVDRHFVDDIPSWIGKDRKAPIWPLYVKTAKEYDKEMLDTWDKGMDVLLIFSALFSAVVTAFLILSLGLLSPDKVQATVDALTVVSAQLSALQSPGSAVLSPYQPVTPFTPAIASVWVNALWSVSLTISLFTSVLAMLVKQWLRAYTTSLSTAPDERARLRHFRYIGIIDWKVSPIVGSLPLLLHIAVLTFFIGFAIYLWTIHLVLAYILTAIWSAGVVAYVALAIAPLIWANCPYKSPLTSALEFVTAPLYLDFETRFRIRELWEETRSQPDRVFQYLKGVWRIMKARRLELHWLKLKAFSWITDDLDRLDTKAFGWLLSTVHGQEDREVVLQSYFGWQPPSKDLEQYADYLQYTAENAISRLLSPVFQTDMYLGAKRPWEELFPLLIKLAVYSTFSPEYIRSRPNWYARPWITSVLEDSADPYRKFFLNVVLLWCAGWDQPDRRGRKDVFDRLQTQAIAQFCSAAESESSPISKFASWLLLQHSRIQIKQNVATSHAMTQIHDQLFPAVNHLVATSLNLPDTFTSSVGQLWRADEEKVMAPQKPEARYHVPELNVNDLATWWRVLRTISTPENRIAARSYAAHNVYSDVHLAMEHGDIGHDAVLFFEEVMLSLEDQQLIYPRRTGRLPTPARLKEEHSLEITLAENCMEAILDRDDSWELVTDEHVTLAALQLFETDSHTVQDLLDLKPLEPEDTTLTACGLVLISSQFRNFVLYGQQYSDPRATTITTLVIGKTLPLPPSVGESRTLPHLIADSGWLEMLRNYGYRDVVRESPKLCQIMQQTLLQFTTDGIEVLLASQLLDVIAEDPPISMIPAFERLLAERHNLSLTSNRPASVASTAARFKAVSSRAMLAISRQFLGTQMRQTDEEEQLELGHSELGMQESTGSKELTEKDGDTK